MVIEVRDFGRSCLWPEVKRGSGAIWPAPRLAVGVNRILIVIKPCRTIKLKKPQTDRTQEPVWITHNCLARHEREGKRCWGFKRRPVGHGLVSVKRNEDVSSLLLHFRSVFDPVWSWFAAIMTSREQWLYLHPGKKNQLVRWSEAKSVSWE